MCSYTTVCYTNLYLRFEKRFIFKRGWKPLSSDVLLSRTKLIFHVYRYIFRLNTYICKYMYVWYIGWAVEIHPTLHLFHLFIHIYKYNKLDVCVSLISTSFRKYALLSVLIGKCV